VPMTKARKIELSRRPFAMIFSASTERINKDLCGECGKPIKPEGFRDNESRREYNISGMCQACQDTVFVTANEM